MQGLPVGCSRTKKTRIEPIPAALMQANPPKNVVLLGDSIFDNASYVKPGAAVIDHLRAMLPKQWSAVLLAVDGATATRVASQVRSIPSDATDLFLSVGGNDALSHTEILDAPVKSSADTWRLLAKVISEFEFAYREAVTACLRKNLPLTVCTIYNGNFPDSDYQLRANVALQTFNDSIVRIAREKGCNSLELRSVCTEPAHYANPIEPSDTGGKEIARAILEVLERRRH
jgi:GDSL-like Lipase/Acylhydrolase family